MESTDKLLDTLLKREEELFSFIEPLKKKYFETESKTEKKSLLIQMKPSRQELRIVVGTIEKLHALLNAATGPAADIAGKTQDTILDEPSVDPAEQTPDEPPVKSTDQRLDALYKRGDELTAIIEPLRKKYNESTSEAEKKSLKLQMRPSVKELKALLDPMVKLEKASLTASAGTAANIAAEALVNPPDKAPAEPTLESPGKAPAEPTLESLDKVPAEPTLESLDKASAEAPVKSHVAPKKPKNWRPHTSSVLRFEAAGVVYCFGHLDRPTKLNTIQVLPYVKTFSTDEPALWIQVKFPRDETPIPGVRFHNPKYHSVWYKSKPNTCEIEDHVVTDEIEFQNFLKDAPQQVHGKAKEAMEGQKLYRIKVSFQDNKIWQAYYPNIYSSSEPEIQKNFDAMALVPRCKTFSVFSWMYPDLPANLQYLYAEQKSYVSPLEPYLHKHKGGKDAYVQWGKIIVPEIESAFMKRLNFDVYSDFNLIVGNGVAREKLNEVNTIDRIRATPIKMTVTQAGSHKDFYLAFLRFPEFAAAKDILIRAGNGLVTWEPPPSVKHQSELAPNEKPARDDVHGWKAYIRTESLIQEGAHLTVLLKRPTDSSNKYMKKEMPTANKLGDTLQSQMVYYKVKKDVGTTKSLLNSLDLLRFKNTEGDEIAEMKRTILCGHKQKQFRMPNLLEGLTDAEIDKLTDGLTPSQRDFIMNYCTKLFNGIGFLQGPAGSGKTTIIKVLVRIAVLRGLKVAIVTDSDSASDNVARVITDEDYIAVRVHSLGLERTHLLKETRKGIAKDTLKNADPEPNDGNDPADNDSDCEPSIDKMPDHDDAAAGIAEPGVADDKHADRIAALDEEAANGPGWVDDNISHKFNDHMMKTALDLYNQAKAIMKPDDPRMKMIESALWTWLLKVISKVDRHKGSPKVNAKLDELMKQDNFIEFKAMVSKSQVQELNTAEWTSYGKLIETCASIFITDTADAVVCTIAQLAMDWSAEAKFGLIVVDEATMMNEAQLVQLWRDGCPLISIGDQVQLGVVCLSKPKTNPFVDQIKYPPFVRFIDNDWPYSMLLEVMRMTVGLEALCSDLFYGGELKPGASTAIDHPSRQMSRTWHTKIHERYPTLKPEPEGSVYPVLFNISSTSQHELSGGFSLINKSNVAVVVQHVCWVIETGIAKAHQIGIATPYGGQVHLYKGAFKGLAKERPEPFNDISVGTAEWWQGRQADYIIVDLVRGTNDQGGLGFMADARRLNVLLSRQRQALVIVGDKACTDPASIDRREINQINSRNRPVIKVFEWMEAKGRLVNVDKRANVDEDTSTGNITANTAGEPTTNDVADNWGWGGGGTS